MEEVQNTKAKSELEERSTKCQGHATCQPTTPDSVLEAKSLPEESVRARLDPTTLEYLGTIENVLHWLNGACHRSSYKILDLSDCSLGDSAMETILTHLLQQNDAILDLVEVNLSGNCLCDVHVGTILARLLEKCTFLRCLRLERNEIDACFVRAMTCATPSKDRRNLDLYLFGNRLGGDGVQALAESIWCSHFSLLHLGSNGLRGGSTKWLARLLVGHKLQDLDLFANSGLFEESISHYRQFCQGLRKSHLQRLRLSMCSLVNDPTAVAVFSHLPFTLQSLQVSNCHLSITAHYALTLQLECLPQLRHLAIDGWDPVEAPPRLEHAWRASLDAHTALCEIQMSRLSTKSEWGRYVLGICKRNQMLGYVREILPNSPPLALGGPMIVRLARSHSIDETGHIPGQSALYSCVREWLAIQACKR